jgi:hypothetical protein
MPEEEILIFEKKHPSWDGWRRLLWKPELISLDWETE